MRSTSVRLKGRAASAVLALALVAAGLGVLSSAIGPVLSSDDKLGVAVGVMLVVIAALPTLWRLRRDPLDAPGVYALATVFYLGITSLAWLGSPYQPGPGLNRHDITKALLVVALATALFGCGARLTGSARVVEAQAAELGDGRGPSRTALLVGYLIGVIGVVASLAFHVYGYVANAAAQGQLASVLQVLAILSDLGGMAVLMVAVTYFATGDRALRSVLIGIVGFQTMFGVISGVKGTTIEPTVFVLLAYIAYRRRIPWRSIGLLVAITLLILVPINTVYRQALRGGAQSTSGALAQALNGPNGVLPSPTDPVSYVFTRFRSIDNVALIVAETPRSFPYADGSHYYELPAIALVPRALWPSKPALTEGADFSYSYWEVPRRIRTSTPLTQVGDLYRNFGLGGVVIGMIVWGLVVGVWQRLRWRWASPVFTAVYLYSLFYYVPYVESDIPALLATATKTLPVAALVAWILLPGRGRAAGYRRLLGSARAQRWIRRTTSARAGS